MSREVCFHTPDEHCGPVLERLKLEHNSLRMQLLSIRAPGDSPLGVVVTTAGEWYQQEEGFVRILAGCIN